ncbi:MAG: site-specific integrase [Oscillatoria sp. SIO1A7]|nr:site-specific integrase [Oscillatoria sp. SIO1A7]
MNELNRYLKDGKIGVTVRQRGDRLCLRGTFPPRPGSSKPKPYQQDIALGVYANPAGFKTAKTEALRAGTMLASGTFDWAHWGVSVKEADVDSGSIEQWLAKFEEDYFSKRAENSKTRSTFKDYEKIWKSFEDFSLPLTKESILKAVLQTEPDTSKRRKATIYLAALAKFAGINVDLVDYKGSYSPRNPVKEKNIPSDKLIKSVYNSIPNPNWRWAFGIQATYGIRPHELFYLNLDNFSDYPGILVVEDGTKTGGRKVWPYQPEWWTEWNLADGIGPQCTGKNNSALSERVCKAYSRYDIPFTSMYLRHAWAIRAALYNLDVSLAAKMMGHSLKVHHSLYHKWLDDRHFQEAWERSVRKQQKDETI